jgi:hypothetical protein
MLGRKIPPLHVGGGNSYFFLGRTPHRGCIPFKIILKKSINETDKILRTILRTLPGGTMSLLKNKGRFYILLSITILMVCFQNCAKQSFQKDYSSSSLGASIEGQTVFYTNSNTVPVTISLHSTFLNEIRTSVYKNMDEKNVPWEPWDSTVEKRFVSLGEEYAPDGSKDGAKVIYVEARDSGTDKRMSTSLNVFLDTQSPKMESLGLLNTGIQGTIYNKGDNVTLEWHGEDPVALSGASSGLDPAAGFRWGIASKETNGDCSESSLSYKTDWMGYRDTQEIGWPDIDALDAFYFCVYARDRAGNTTNILSQPMTSLWNVIAGDNSQGNGTTVTSKKVRFKRISHFSVDPQRNLHFRDQAFGTNRVIKAFENDSSRTIELSAILPAFTEKVIFDKDGYGYLNDAKSIIQLTPDFKTQKIILKSPGISGLAFRNYKGTDRLVIAHNSAPGINDPSAQSYLLEIPLSEIKALTSPIVLDATTITHYKIAGSGIIPASSEVTPTEIILTANDPVDAAHSLGMMQDIATSESGEIYVVTKADGAGRGWGNHSIRRLTPQDGGSFKQTILMRGTWISQLAYRPQKNEDGTTSEYLFASQLGADGSVVIDLKTGILSKPFPELKGEYAETIAVVPTLDNKNFDIYIGSSTHSQIYHYDSHYTLLETLGRPIYGETINDALAFILGNPDGLVQDPFTSDLYVVDSQNSVIQKVDSAGQINKINGTYTPVSSFLNGYCKRIAADFDPTRNRKVLYSYSSAGINVIDLINNTDNLLYGALPNNTSDSKYNWGIDSLSFIKGDNDQNILLAKRHWAVAKTTDWNVGFTGYVHKMNLSGMAFAGTHTQLIGNTMKGQPDISSDVGIINNSDVVFSTDLSTKIVTDSQKNIFTSGSKFKLSKLGTTTTRILNLNIPGAFTIVEEGNLRYLIYQSGTKLGMSTVDVSLKDDLSKNPVISSKKLCLVGTNLNGVRDFITDKDGNIILSDANNARVLKYRIRKSDGTLNFNFCP